MKRTLRLSGLAMLAALTFTTPMLALAATETPLPLPGDGTQITLEHLLSLLTSAASSGQWGMFGLALTLGAVMVYMSVASIRLFILKLLPEKLAVWLSGDKGGVALSFLAGFLGSMVVALSAGQKLSVGLVLGILCSLIASGFRSWKQKVQQQPATAAPPATAPAVCTPEQMANGDCKR